MYVSIHAPHEGERPFIRKKQGLFMTFQSTLPTRGSDSARYFFRFSLIKFQSTLPTRGSDSSFTASSNDIKVSIHAPHEGERPAFSAAAFSDKSFNPRSPRGGATINLPAGVYANGVSIHAPHEGERRQYHRTVI